MERFDAWKLNLTTRHRTFRVVGEMGPAPSPYSGSAEVRSLEQNTGITATGGHPIYWLNGDLVANDYADFLDGAWSTENSPKNQAGNTPLAGCLTVNVGCWTGMFPTTNAGYLGGRPKDLSQPITYPQYTTVGILNDANYRPLDGLSKPRGHQAHMYAISPIFSVGSHVENKVRAQVTVSDAVEGNTGAHTQSDITVMVTLPRPIGEGIRFVTQLAVCSDNGAIHAALRVANSDCGHLDTARATLSNDTQNDVTKAGDLPDSGGPHWLKSIRITAGQTRGWVTYTPNDDSNQEGDELIAVKVFPSGIERFSRWLHSRHDHRAGQGWIASTTPPDGRTANGWLPVWLSEIDDDETSGHTNTPFVNIVASGTDYEGYPASFMLRANPAPESPLVENVEITATGDTAS